MTPLPSINSREELEDMLSEPTAGVIETMRRIDGDILVLGVAGKMGPTLARMAKRASLAANEPRKVIGVSRFSDSRQEAELRSHGIETIRCDLLDEAGVAKLPDAPNVVFMAGMKFGSTGQEASSWAMNCFLPSIICRRYAQSRIVAFSTGNVYALTPVSSGGPPESTLPQPVGEYAMSCLGRERMFEHFGRVQETRVALLRLNYACELRYGVLVDLAQRVFNEQPVDLGMGHFNTIWQGDANAMALQAFDHVATPPFVVNLTGLETLSVRQTCEQFGRLLNKRVALSGTEAPSALLSNAQLAHRLFGPPRINAEQMMKWIADWISRGGETLGKPTHFEVRDGKF